MQTDIESIILFNKNERAAGTRIPTALQRDVTLFLFGHRERLRFGAFREVVMTCNPNGHFGIPHCTLG